MLHYIGKGGIAGIPAKDLSDEEVKKAGESLLAIGLSEQELKDAGGAEGFLVSSGLYKKAGSKPAPMEDKLEIGPVENKDGE
jgi:hypothetical protein